MVGSDAIKVSSCLLISFNSSTEDTGWAVVSVDDTSPVGSVLATSGAPLTIGFMTGLTCWGLVSVACSATGSIGISGCTTASTEGAWVTAGSMGSGSGFSLTSKGEGAITWLGSATTVFCCSATGSGATVVVSVTTGSATTDGFAICSEGSATGSLEISIGWLTIGCCSVSKALVGSSGPFNTSWTTLATSSRVT